MRKLKLTKILEYYDVPQLFVAEDASGVSYLCLLYDIEDDGELKVLGVATSSSKLDDFVEGQIDLLSMFENPEKKTSIYDIIMAEDSIYAKHFMGDIDKTMLPDKGYFYHNSLV